MDKPLNIGKSTSSKSISSVDIKSAPTASPCNELSYDIISDGQPYRAIINYLIDTRKQVIRYYEKHPDACDCKMSSRVFAEMLREAADIIDKSYFESKV